MKAFKIKKQILCSGIGLIIVLLFSIIYIASVGNCYEESIPYLPENASASDIALVVDNHNILRVNHYRVEDGCLFVNVEGLEKGSAVLTVELDNGDEPFVDESKFYVNSLHTVFETTYGGIRFNGSQIVMIAIIIQLVIMVLSMIWLFAEYLKKGEFSNSMIACCGFGLYLLILLGYIVYSLFDFSLASPSFSYFISLFTSAGYNLLRFLTPLMFLFSVSLVISNLQLIRHEGFRPTNLLGVAFALLWGAGAFLTLGAIHFPVVWKSKILQSFVLPLIYTVVYMECMLLSTVFCSFLAVKHNPAPDLEYIIILGCAIRRDGSLTPLLKSRADSAVAFERKQYEATGKHAVFVPSGGQGADEVISEGEAIENYLRAIGIPSEQIARESKSTNTYENLLFSKRVIDRHAGSSDSKIGFATTNYHVFRGYVLAKKIGFTAKGISAKTKLYFFPNAFLREFVGLLADKKWKHLVFVLLTILLFVLIAKI